MRVVSAFLLARLGGNASPDAAAINNILGSVGVEAEASKISQLLSELEGKDVDEVIAAGVEKLASVPSGGAAPAAGGAAAGGADAPAAAAAPEPESEEDDDMGFSLFD